MISLYKKCFENQKDSPVRTAVLNIINDLEDAPDFDYLQKETAARMLLQKVTLDHQPKSILEKEQLTLLQEFLSRDILAENLIAA